MKAHPLTFLVRYANQKSPVNVIVNVNVHRARSRPLPFTQGRTSPPPPPRRLRRWSGAYGQAQRAHLGVGVAHHQAQAGLLAASRGRSSCRRWRASPRPTPASAPAGRRAPPPCPRRALEHVEDAHALAGIDRALDAAPRSPSSAAQTRQQRGPSAPSAAEHHLQRVLGRARPPGRTRARRPGATGRGSRPAACSKVHALAHQQAALAAQAAVQHGIAPCRAPTAAASSASARGQRPAAQHGGRSPSTSTISAPLCSTRGTSPPRASATWRAAGMAAAGDQHQVHAPRPRRVAAPPACAARASCPCAAACRRCRARAAGSAPRRAGAFTGPSTPRRAR